MAEAGEHMRTSKRKLKLAAGSVFYEELPQSLPATLSPKLQSDESDHSFIYKPRPSDRSPVPIFKPRPSVRSPTPGAEQKRRTLPLPSRHLSLSPDIHHTNDFPTLTTLDERQQSSVQSRSPPNRKSPNRGCRLKSQMSVPYSSNHQVARGDPSAVTHDFSDQIVTRSQKRSPEWHKMEDDTIASDRTARDLLPPRITSGFVVSTIVPGSRGTSYEEELEDRLNQIRVSAQIWRQRAIFERSRRKELEDELEAMERGYRSAMQEQQVISEKKYERLKNKTRLLMRRCEQLRRERSDLDGRLSVLQKTSAEEKLELGQQMTRLSAEVANQRSIMDQKLMLRQSEYNTWLAHYRLLLKIALEKVKELEANKIGSEKCKVVKKNNPIEKVAVFRSKSFPNGLNESDYDYSNQVSNLRRKSVSDEDLSKLRIMLSARLSKVQDLKQPTSHETNVVKTHKRNRSSIKLQVGSKCIEIRKSFTTGKPIGSSSDTLKRSSDNTTSSSIGSISRSGQGSSCGVQTLSDGYISEESEGWKGRIRRRKGRKVSKYKHRSLERSVERRSTRNLTDIYADNNSLCAAPQRPVSLPETRPRKSDRSGSLPQLELLRRFNFGHFISQLGSSSGIEAEEDVTDGKLVLSGAQRESLTNPDAFTSSKNLGQITSFRLFELRKACDTDIKHNAEVDFTIQSAESRDNSFDYVKNRERQSIDIRSGASLSDDVSRSSVGEIHSVFERLRERRNGLTTLPEISRAPVRSASRSKLDQLAKSIKTYLQ